MTSDQSTYIKHQSSLDTNSYSQNTRCDRHDIPICISDNRADGDQSICLGLEGGLQWILMFCNFYIVVLFFNSIVLMLGINCVLVNTVERSLQYNLTAEEDKLLSKLILSPS